MLQENHLTAPCNFTIVVKLMYFATFICKYVMSKTGLHFNLGIKDPEGLISQVKGFGVSSLEVRGFGVLGSKTKSYGDFNLEFESFGILGTGF